MVTTTDTQAIAAHAERNRLLELWTGIGAAFLMGGLLGGVVIAATFGLGVHARPIGPYVGLGALGLALTAFIAALTRRSIGELSTFIRQEAGRNHRAIQAVLHDQEALARTVSSAAVSTVATQQKLAGQVEALTKELARVRKRLDPVPSEQQEQDGVDPTTIQALRRINGKLVR